MCGIAGIIGTSPVQPDELRRMADCMRYRGPDDQGLYVDGPVGLAHNRLSILDLSAAGHQPMHSGPVVLVFNGEIYNYLELRADLAREHGWEFSSHTDTEVILAAYRVWGRACVSRFRGMWAFALWDEQRQEVVLSRDRLGIKPLYYAWDGQRLLFASEIKAILAAGHRAAPNEEVLADFLVGGFLDHREDTCFAGVRQLLPGHNAWLETASRRWATQPYYDLGAAVAACTPTVEAFETALTESVALHLRSDVPVGTCLSGGLDSSTIAALAGPLYREASGRPMKAITALSGDVRDESAYAAQVVERVGLDWIRTAPSLDDFQTLLPRILWHQEQPTGGPSVVMQYAVMEAARDAEISVLLDGQGGDELLLGYERYYSYAFRSWLGRGQIGRAAREFALAGRHSGLSHATHLRYALYFQSNAARRLFLKRRSRAVDPRWFDLAEPTIRSLGRSGGTLRDLQIRELTAAQLPHLLRFEDRNSMAHSIEARVPFVDHRVVEQAVALPPEAKIRDGYTKFALRQVAEPRLPASIAWRRTKIGFEAPVSWADAAGRWMEDQIVASPLVRGMLSVPVDARPLVLPATLKYRLFEIALWERTFLR